MFAARTCVHRRLGLAWVPRRWRSQISQDMLQPATPLAEQLADTGLWNYGRWAKPGKDTVKKAAKGTAAKGAAAKGTAAKGTAAKGTATKAKGDRNRVNIVSEELCDDILGTLDLDRHRGCDLVDIYPGAGLWSSKLHAALQPRSHLLLEPDASLYRPFLEATQPPLLGRPGVALLPKSGIVWRDLSSVLDATHLPHQHVQRPDADATPRRNDTLLVTANLAFFPRRRFGVFESLTQLVLYQFVSSIRASALFHKYGLVRMLVWVENHDRHGLLARSCQRRRRLAIDGELATEWLAEVAGPDDAAQWFVRDQQLDRASVRATVARMADKGITVPPRRQTQAMIALGHDNASATATATAAAAADAPAVFARPYRDELQRLELAFAAGAFAKASASHRRLRSLQYRATRERKVADTLHGLLRERDALAAEAAKAEAQAPTEDFLRRQDKWNAAVDALPANARMEFLLQRDNRHLLAQTPPVLAWDRRAREPLAVQPDEFFPNAPCALLDVQPKPMHPLLRAMGPGTSRAGSMFELLLRGMLAQGGEPVSKSIETVWPGAAQLLAQCPSLQAATAATPDAAVAGGIGGPYGELSARVLNEQQWTEILAAWMAWPFRPSLAQLVARIGDEAEDVDDGAAAGGGEEGPTGGVD